MARPPKTLPSATPWSASPPSTSTSSQSPASRLLCVVAAAAVVVVVAAAAASAAPAGPPNGQYPQVHPPKGCWFEGTRHDEGSAVRVREPCLRCACASGALRCVRRACAPLPDPPPRGCVLVHRKGICCPSLRCDGDGEVTTRNFEETPPLADEIPGSKGCVWNGTRYAEGSAMTSSSLCEFCFCIRGRQRCVRPRCLLPEAGCAPRFHRLACCPQSYDCSREMNATAVTATTTSQPTEQLQGCILNKKWYMDGDMVQPKNKKQCENCFCMKGKIECVPLSCAPPLQGCLPIITQGDCCPALYNCSTKPMLSPEVQSVLHKTEGITNLQENQGIESSNISADPSVYTSNVSAVDYDLKTDLTASKLQLLFEGRSHREMPGKENTTESVIHKISPCNATNKQEETTERATTTSTTNTTTTIEEGVSTTITTTTEVTTTEITSTQLTTETSTQVTTDTSTLPSTTFNENTTSITTESEMTTVNTTVTLGSTTTMETTEETRTKGSTNVNGEETTTNGRPKIETKIQERIAPTESIEETRTTFTDDVITLKPDNALDTERNRITTEQNSPIPVQTDSTFMTLIPTTVIMPEELDVVNITLHKNVSIVEHENTSKTMNGSQPPVRAIPPEIEAILNITQKKDEDYEYDYNEPSLPPSLPGVRIIPFVAADAVVEDKNSPTVYPKDKHRPTDSPIFYEVSHPNLFSPPVETEGGFVPREPILDGPFYESKFDGQYHTTGINVPPGHMPLDITSGTIMPPAITVPPKNEDERCLSNKHEYRHGELLAQTDPCLRCICYYGEVLCQATKCPPLKPGCRRLRHKDKRSCCGRLVCGDTGESPTVVLDATVRPALQPPGPPLLGPVVPPITVADGVVTPDPFRDVIRTEKAPDLPALIGDIMPYLLERRTVSPQPPATSPMPPAASTSSFSTTSPATSSDVTTPSSVTPVTPTTVAVSSTSTAVTESTTTRKVSEAPNITSTINIFTMKSTTIMTSTPVTLLTTERISTTTESTDTAAPKNDYDDDDSEFSFDSVLQFLFSGDSTTKPPTAKTTRPPKLTTTVTAATTETMTTALVTSTLTPESTTNSTFGKDTTEPDSTNTTVDKPDSTTNTTQQLLEIFNISLHMTGDTTSSPGTSESGLSGALGGNSLGEIPADPGAASGLLKLAGCNIYGRMYRVGRIISELSGPCLECMCTEVGVQCRALDC